MSTDSDVGGDANSSTLESGSRADVTDDLVPLSARVPLRGYLRRLWDRRELAIALPVSNLRAQNRDSVLGGLWHLLNPLLLVGVYFLVFGVLLNTSRGTDNFIAFLSIGVFVFNYTSRSITAGARSIVANEDLIRSVKFPRALLPISAVLGEALALGFAILTMLVVVVLTGEPFSASWFLLFPVLALQTIFNLGAACVVARFTSHFRDLQQILPFMLRLWLYVSGVFYAVETFVEDEAALALLRLNPAHLFMELARDSMLHGGTAAADWGMALAWSAVVTVGGFAFFRAHEHEYGRG